METKKNHTNSSPHLGGRGGVLITYAMHKAPARAGIATLMTHAIKHGLKNADNFFMENPFSFSRNLRYRVIVVKHILEGFLASWDRQVCQNI